MACSSRSHAFVLAVLLTVLFCAAEARYGSGRPSKALSVAANTKLTELFELLKNEDWLNKLMQEISEKKANRRELEEQIVDEQLADRVRSSRRRSSKLDLRRTRGIAVSDSTLEDLLQRGRRSATDPLDGHGQRPSDSDPPAFANTEQGPSHPEVAIATTSTLPDATSHATTAAHAHQHKFNFTFPACPAQYSYCIYGDCIDLGHAVYVCNCAEGYTGMSCEILDLQTAVADLVTVAGNPDPEQAAVNNPAVYSSASAIAQYLAGDIQTFH